MLKSPGPVESSPDCQGLWNAFAQLRFFWVQYKDTGRTDRLRPHRTAGLLKCHLTHHYSIRPEKRKPTPRHSQPSTSQFCFLTTRKAVSVRGRFDLLNIRTQAWLLTFIYQHHKNNVEDTMFLKIRQHRTLRVRRLDKSACEAESTVS